MAQMRSLGIIAMLALLAFSLSEYHQRKSPACLSGSVAAIFTSCERK